MRKRNLGIFDCMNLTGLGVDPLNSILYLLLTTLSESFCWLAAIRSS